MACTVIRPADMADNILDREKHPEWQGERTKMVYAFPSSEKLWGKYAELRADSLRNDGDGREATEFYRQHRGAMDAGATIAWPQRFNEDELSAIQHAMNLRFRDEAAFFAEYQNEPIVEAVGEEMLSGEQIAAKLNGYRTANAPQRSRPVEPAAPVDEVKPAGDSVIARAKAEAISHPKREIGNGNGNGHGHSHGTPEAQRSAMDPARRGLGGASKTEAAHESVLTTAMKEMQSDAPACDVCGTITVRNGTCYKCMNCGNSMGCS